MCGASMVTRTHLLASARQEVEALCQSLHDNTTLLELRAGGRQIDAAAAAAFARLLAANGTMRLLCVGGTELGDEGAAALAEGLAKNRALRELDLAGPRGIGHDGAVALAQAIHAQSHPLTATNGMSGAAEDKCWLSNGAKDGRAGLRVLDLSQNAIGSDGICSLARVASSLERLTLSTCGADSLAAAALGRAASCKASRLRDLDLSGNPLGAGGASALAAGLTSGGHAVLETLNLADTGLTDEGAVVMLAAAAKLPSLRRLDLSRCGLTGYPMAHKDGGECLNSLTSLLLSGNELSSNGIAAVMGTCTNLTSADLSGELHAQRSACKPQPL